jgi:dihydroceramide fatty acyl 2-hydroxylase
MDHNQTMTEPSDLFGRLRYAWLCTRPFWVYPPLIAVILVWAGPRGGWGLSAGLFALGLFAWTLVEWVLHWSMHVRTPWKGFRNFQEFAHLRHHREPDDLPGSIVTLRGSIPLALLFFGLSLALFRSLVPATLFYAGMTAGYVFYEFVHFATHARWKIPAITWLERYHALHHSRQWNRTFGVSCPLWDYVFGTAPRPPSPRHQSSH